MTRAVNPIERGCQAKSWTHKPRAIALEWESMEFCRRRIVFLAVFLWVFCGFVRGAWAGQDLLVRKELDVYAEKSTESQILRTLEKGDRVPLSPKKYGVWRKVLLRSPDRNTVGWIQASDMAGSITIESEGAAGPRSSKARRTSFIDRSFIGLSIVSSLAKQGARAIPRQDGTSENVSALEGVSTFPMLFFDGSLGSTLGFRIYGGLRSMLTTGTLTTGGSTPLEVSQSFYSGGALIRIYSNPQSAFWYGGGVEVAKAYRAKVIYSKSTEVDIPAVDLPIYVIGRGGVGYHVSVGSTFVVNLEAFLNVIPNSKPVIYAGELVVSAALGF